MIVTALLGCTTAILGVTAISMNAYISELKGSLSGIKESNSKSLTDEIKESVLKGEKLDGIILYGGLGVKDERNIMDVTKFLNNFSKKFEINNRFKNDSELILSSLKKGKKEQRLMEYELKRQLYINKYINIGLRAKEYHKLQSCLLNDTQNYEEFCKTEYNEYMGREYDYRELTKEHKSFHDLVYGVLFKDTYYTTIGIEDMYKGVLHEEVLTDMEYQEYDYILKKYFKVGCNEEVAKRVIDSIRLLIQSSFDDIEIHGDRIALKRAIKGDTTLKPNLLKGMVIRSIVGEIDIEDFEPVSNGAEITDKGLLKI